MLLQRLFLHWLHHCLAIVCHCKPSSSIDPFNWENLPKITSQLKAHLGIYQLLSFHYILSYSFTIFSGFSQNKWLIMIFPISMLQNETPRLKCLAHTRLTSRCNVWSGDVFRVQIFAWLIRAKNYFKHKFGSGLGLELGSFKSNPPLMGTHLVTNKIVLTRRRASFVKIIISVWMETLGTTGQFSPPKPNRYAGRYVKAEQLCQMIFLFCNIAKMKF